MKKHLLKTLQIALYVLLFAGGVLTCFLTLGCVNFFVPNQ